LDLCEQALLLDVKERPAFLEKACSGDDNLRASVESLLQAVEDSGSFLLVSGANDKQEC